MCVNDLLETWNVAVQTIHSLGVNIELGMGGGGKVSGRLHSHCQELCKFIETKESFHIIIRFKLTNLADTNLFGRHFIPFGHQHSGRDVTIKKSVHRPIDLIHNTRHLCAGFRIDGIKVAPGISEGKEIGADFVYSLKQNVRFEYRQN